MRPVLLALVAILLVAPALAAAGSDAQPWRLLESRLEVAPGTMTGPVAHDDEYVVTLLVQNEASVPTWGKVHLESYWVVYNFGNFLMQEEATLAPGEVRTFTMRLPVGTSTEQIWFVPGPFWLCAFVSNAGTNDHGDCWSAWGGSPFVARHYPQDLEHPLGLPFE
jgi:hypothetical protein